MAQTPRLVVDPHLWKDIPKIDARCRPNGLRSFTHSEDPKVAQIVAERGHQQGILLDLTRPFPSMAELKQAEDREQNIHSMVKAVVRNVLTGLMTAKSCRIFIDQLPRVSFWKPSSHGGFM